MTTIIKCLLFSLTILISHNIIAQVGIVTGIAKASLHVTPVSTGNSTAEGIIAPNLTRSQLISKDAQYKAAQTGSLIYITTIDGTITTKTAKVIRVGYYYFDGSLWQSIDQPGQNFYLPVFDLPTSAIGTGYTFDLYNNVYKKQFIQSGNSLYKTNNAALSMIPSARYTPTDIDYVITYYDADVVNINSISTSGVINYDVKSTLLGPNSFINVVFVTKK